MANVILGLAGYNEVRAQLGVTDKDVSDQYLDDLGIDQELRLDLLQWFPNYAALLADTSNDPVVGNQIIALKTYARAFCAYKTSYIAPMKFLQKRADGDNQGVRFQHSHSLGDLQNDLSNKVADLKNIVLGFSTSYNPSAAKTAVSAAGMLVSKPADIIVRT